MMSCQYNKSHQNTSYVTPAHSSFLSQQLVSLKNYIQTLQIFIQSLNTDAPLTYTTQCLIQTLYTESVTLSLTKTLSTVVELTLNQTKKVVQAKSDHIIKELKASSSSVASKLYTEITYFFITTTSVLKAYISAHVSCEITIKSDSKTLKQHLQTK